MNPAPPAGAGPVITEATARDTDPLLALAAAEADPTVDWAPIFANDLERPDRYLVVARGDGEVAGYGRTGWFEPPSDAPATCVPVGYLLIGLVVAPSWRRRGVARALTAARLTWVAARADHAWCFTEADNDASLALHLELGFVEVTREMWFPGGGFAPGSHVLLRWDRDRPEMPR